MNKIFMFLFTIIFLSCTSTNNVTPVNQPVSITGKDDNGTKIKIDNPTSFNVYFTNGQLVAKKTNGTTVTLFLEKGALSRPVDILYEIPLSGNVPLYCKGDSRTFRENQTSFTVIEPNITDNYGPFIIIQNKVNNAISFFSSGNSNPGWIQKGNPKDGNNLDWSDKHEFSPTETTVFDINRDIDYNNYSIRDGRKVIPLVLPARVRKNYLYSFEYTASGVELTDSRPLHRIGESAWVKKIENIDYLLPLVTEDGEISLFASVDKDNRYYRKGLNRIVFDSVGNEKNKKIIPSGDNFIVTYTSSINDGFFIAGYKQEGRNQYKAQTCVVSADGVIRRILPENNNYETTRLFTAARKDNTWLLVGYGNEIGVIGNRAYARLVRDEDNKLITDKEWGRNDFPQYKNIKAAAYNDKIGCWLITGEIEGSSSGFYLAGINNNGEIREISKFPGMEFYKILVDNGGNYYLIGQEQKSNKTYAVLVKFDINNKKLWQSPEQPAFNSYYQTAVFDNENNCIVLAGTLQAVDEYGTGGKPFIEAVSVSNGTRVWHEVIIDSECNLVTAVESMPDYGYVLSVSDIKDGIIGKSFKILRINSQGKLNNF
jgi:hypothetical protein